MKDNCSVVSMKDVPEPPSKATHGRIGALYFRAGSLKRGEALCIACRDQKHMMNTRSQLKAKAKKDGQFMSTSWTADFQNLYIWLESK